MPKLKCGSVVELRSLLSDGFRNLGTTVTQTSTPQARQTIKNSPAVRVNVVGIFRTDDDARVSLELSVARERHPVRVEPFCRPLSWVDKCKWFR